MMETENVERINKKKMRRRGWKMDLSYLSYFVIVFIFCDHRFFFSAAAAAVIRFLSLLYIENRNPVYFVIRHFMDVFFPSFWFTKPLFSYSPTHCVCATFLKRKISISAHCPCKGNGHKDVVFLYLINTYRYLCYHWDCFRLLSNRMEMKSMKMEYATLVIGSNKTGNKQKKWEKVQWQNSTEISVIYFEISNCSAMILWITFFSSLISLLVLLSLFLPFVTLTCTIFKIQFKIVCLEDLWVYCNTATYALKNEMSDIFRQYTVYSIQVLAWQPNKCS